MLKAYLVGFNSYLFCMRVYAQVKFLACDKHNFTSDQGEYVEYHVNAIRGEGGIMELNSKADFSELEGKEGVAEIEAKESENGKGWKLTLKGFRVGEELDLPEAEVD
jgi:hypothetical protein